MKLPLTQSLRFRFPVSVLLGVIVPVLAGITLASSHASNIIASKTEETLKLEAKSLTNTVEQWTRMNVLAVQNLSKQPDITNLDPVAQIPLLEQIVNNYQHIYIAHTVDLDGVNIARSDRNNAKKYSDRSWFKGAIANNDITYQTLIGRTNNQPAVCFATPIRRANTVVAAAVNICSNLTEIAEEVGATTIGKTGYAFIVDGEGKVIAHPDPTIISGENLVDLSNFAPVANLLAGNRDYFTFKDKTETEWVSQGIKLDNGWGVIVLQEAAEALLPARKFQQVAISIGLVTIALTGAMAYFLVDCLVRPLQKITTVAEQMSQGNLTEKTNVDSQDELGILSSTIDTMAAQLQEAFVKLENQYQEQTEKMLDAQKSSQEQQLQARIKALQQEIAPVSQGDLTVRAMVTEDEIGLIANSYNFTLESLSLIVSQVQAMTKVVAQNTNRNEEEITSLSTNIIKQTEEIASALNIVQNMAQSMALVSQNALKAENSIKQATERVKQGDMAINATVKRIVSLGESTAAAKEQVKNLGKASRKISKAVDLIRKIALQTNVLAVNASIEAARAGEEGMGFTVVAEEVQSLAAHSAKTATDIEKLALEIQGETNKVIKVMEHSSQEIMQGSQLMKNTRLSLQQVTEASLEINRSIEDITKAATEQSNNSKTVTATIEEVAAIANKTSTSADDVSMSFKELLQVTEQLEASINRFKVK